MASKFPKDTATAGLKRDPVSGAVLVNLDDSVSFDREQTGRDVGTQGLLRDKDGAVLVKTTGLPSSVLKRSGDPADEGKAVDARTGLPLVLPVPSVVQDEGVDLPLRGRVNFVGDGVTAEDVGGKTRVTVPGGAVTPPRLPAAGFDADPPIHTTFAEQEYDESLFDFVNTTRVMDGTTPAIQTAAEATEASISAKDRLTFFDVRVRYRPTSSTAQSSAYIEAFGAATGPRNRWSARKAFSTGNPIVSSIVRSSNAVNSGAQYTEDVSLGLARWIRERREHDVHLVKTWLAWTTWRSTWSAATSYVRGDGVSRGSAGTQSSWVCINDAAASATPPESDPTKWVRCDEPEWQIVRRIRPTGGGGVTGSTTTSDNPERGFCGVAWRYLSGFIYELSVTPLRARQDNLIANSSLRRVDTTDLIPVGWSLNTATSAGNTADVVDVDVGALHGLPLNPRGEPRRALHLNHTVSVGQFWTQFLYSSSQAGPRNGLTGRSRLHPMIQIPRAFELLYYSKGLNVVSTNNPNPNAAGHDVYYYDREGAGLINLGDGGFGRFTYYGTAAPNDSGIGTWDWTLTRVRIELNQPHRVAYLRVMLGFHDPALGEVWFLDPTIRPVS